MINHLGKNHLGINNLGINHLGINHLGINHLGINHLGINHLGINHLGINHLGIILVEKKQAGKFRAYFERNCSEIMFVFHAKTVNVGISKLEKNYTALRHILNLEKMHSIIRAT